MMGFFTRKNSKASADEVSTTKSGRNSTVTLQSIQSSRSPQPANDPRTPPTPTVEMPIPKAPNPDVDPAAYLRSIYAVRERTSLVFAKAKTDELLHFDVDMTKFVETAAYVVSIIKRDYAPDYSSIPPHGRWQHFDVGGRARIDQLLVTWPTELDTQERTRRLIDLFTVSVLLDAGAGALWSYKSKVSGKSYRRSEGLAVASLEMFKAGAFSSNPENPFQVDGAALKRMTPDQLAQGLQASEQNPLAGLEGRIGLLIGLGDALSNQQYFGSDARPGGLLNYLLSHPTTKATSVPIICVPTLWDALMDGLGPIWPASRTAIAGRSLGDAWPCRSMPSGPLDQPWERIVAFHKLTQWLTYSLMTPMAKLLHIQFAGSDLLTGLPEYRNGGLLVDTGLLTLKAQDMERGLSNYRDNAKVEGQPHVEVVPLFATDDDVIVEWRAVTVGFLDALLVEVNRQLGLEGGAALSLAQMLEAGTWKGGRELAEVSRPNTKQGPIMIQSDGTIF